LSIAFLIIVPIILFAPVFLSGKLIYGFDVLTCHMPYRIELQRNLALGQWPLWMPDILGGMPGIAACNLYFLYPSDLVSNLAGWPVQLQFGLDAAMHVALAGVGMFLFLRRMGRSRSGALLGAFFFAVSGSEVSQLFGGYYCFVEGIALVPWAFWAAHKGLKEGSWFAWGLCGLAFALQILAQATQIFAYTLPAVAAFVLALEWRHNMPLTAGGSPKRRIAALLPVLQGLLLSLVLALLLASPQLLPTLQYLPLCARRGYSHADFIGGSIAPAEALSWLVPGFFGWRIPTYHGPVMGSTCTTEYFGLLPWALAAGAVAALWRREPAVRWMAALALTAFFFAQRQWTPFYSLFRHLPVFSSFRIWSRILFLLTFAVCTLASYGWDASRTVQRRAQALRGVAFFSALALLAAALAYWLAADCAAGDGSQLGWFTGSLNNPQAKIAVLTLLARDSAQTTLMLIPLLLALLWFGARRLGTGAALVLALALHIQDQKPVYERFVKFMAPPPTADLSQFPLPSPPRGNQEPWRIFDDDAAFPNRSVPQGYENLGGMESVPLQSAQRIMAAMARRKKDWFDLMNVRYVLSAPPGGGSVTVHENPGALRRAWLVASIRPVADDEEAYRLLADPRFDPKTEAALEAESGPYPHTSPLEPPLRGSIRWLDRSPQTSSLDVSCSRATALVLSDYWHPSWKATVDGRETVVLEADGGLQAVLLSAGSHHVDFRFDPTLFYEGLAAALAGLVALAGLPLLKKSPGRT
jgi:hypothetical protein